MFSQAIYLKQLVKSLGITWLSIQAVNEYDHKIMFWAIKYLIFTMYSETTVHQFNAICDLKCWQIETIFPVGINLKWINPFLDPRCMLIYTFKTGLCVPVHTQNQWQVIKISTNTNKNNTKQIKYRRKLNLTLLCPHREELMA